MDNQSKEEFEETWKEVKEVKEALSIESTDTALLVMIYNEMINEDNALRDLAHKE